MAIFHAYYQPISLSKLLSNSPTAIGLLKMPPVPAVNTLVAWILERFWRRHVVKIFVDSTTWPRKI